MVDGRFEDRILEHAQELGLGLAGIADIRPSDHTGFYDEWIEKGRHGTMEYLARDDARARRADVRRTMEGVRSAVVVGQNYFQQDPEGVPEDPSRGVIARYARGRDYHKVLKNKLQDLSRWIEEHVGEQVREQVGDGAGSSDGAGDGEGDGVIGRVYVDTGPILERELARRAGLGWFGRNTMILHPREGSYFFLGVLLLDMPLEPTGPFEGDHCGTCNRCVEACPTDALLGRDEKGAPVMDARRCISYLTIENQGPIPEELRPLMGNRIYGCDICQEVCPFNVRFAEEAEEPGYAARGPGERPVGVEALPGEKVSTGRDGTSTGGSVSAETPGRTHVHPGTDGPPLAELMRMTRDDWDVFSRGSAIRRAGYAGFKRNVAVAMGNWLASVDDPPDEAVAVLRAALEEDEPLIREHAAWALALIA